MAALINILNPQTLRTIPAMVFIKSEKNDGNEVDVSTCKFDGSCDDDYETSDANSEMSLSAMEWWREIFGVNDGESL